LEDEKVGLHVAYGTSAHLGGKSKWHTLDIVYAKGCPIEGKSLTLFDEKEAGTEIIRDSQLDFGKLKLISEENRLF
jgi:hypothetical protein